MKKITKERDLAKSNDINTENDFEDLLKNIGSSQFEDTLSIRTEFVEEYIKESVERPQARKEKSKPTTTSSGHNKDFLKKEASEKLASLKRSKSEEKINKLKPREQSSTPEKPQNDEAEAHRITENKYHVKQNIRKIIQRYKSRKK
ncbi:hypothetical protein JTB14_002014 [Gonioctena quinquepunctata]|nr:hypothetical protein JTB14_002014 [Gonioctena quinquepunctata]